MLKIEDNEIKIYRNIKKEDLKASLIIFIIGFVAGIVMSILFKTWFFFCLLSIFSGIFLLICLNLYKQAGKEKLMYSLSEDAFTIYKKEKIFKKYSISNIKSFAIFPSEYNKVILNFKNEKGKNDSKVFILQGCKNTDFVEMSNEFLKSNINMNEIKESVKISNVNKEEKKLQEDTKLINELIKNKEKIKVAFLGKTKQFILNGNRYMYERTPAEFIFVTEDDTLLSFYTDEIEIDLFQISFNNQYTLYYDKNKQCFIAIKENNELDSKKIEKIERIRNSIDFKFKLTVDSKIIIQEVELSNKVSKTTSIFKTILLIVILVCVLLLIFKIKVLLPHAVFISILILLFYPVVLLIIIMQYKRKYFNK